MYTPCAPIPARHNTARAYDGAPTSGVQQPASGAAIAQRRQQQRVFRRLQRRADDLTNMTRPLDARSTTLDARCLHTRSGPSGAMRRSGAVRSSVMVRG